MKWVKQANWLKLENKILNMHSDPYWSETRALNGTWKRSVSANCKAWLVRYNQLVHVLNSWTISRRAVASSCLQLKRKTNAKIRCGKFQFYFCTSFFSFKAKVGYFFSPLRFSSAIWVKGRLCPSTVSTLVLGYIYLERADFFHSCTQFVLLFTLSPRRRFPAGLCLCWPGDSHTIGLAGG